MADKVWDVWMEGYAATGGSSRATYEGRFPGATFLEACRVWAKTCRSPSLYQDADGIPRYWGCRLFDNGEDARRSYG